MRDDYKGAQTDSLLKEGPDLLGAHLTGDIQELFLRGCNRSEMMNTPLYSQLGLKAG